jgi:hypothetical protein
MQVLPLPRRNSWPKDWPRIVASLHFALPGRKGHLKVGLGPAAAAARPGFPQFPSWALDAPAGRDPTGLASIQTQIESRVCSSWGLLGRLPLHSVHSADLARPGPSDMAGVEFTVNERRRPPSGAGGCGSDKARRRKSRQRLGGGPWQQLHVESAGGRDLAGDTRRPLRSIVCQWVTRAALRSSAQRHEMVTDDSDDSDDGPGVHLDSEARITRVGGTTSRQESGWSASSSPRRMLT